MKYLYVIQCTVSTQSTPVASFWSRAKAESFLQTQLLQILAGRGVSSEAIDFFTVEQWEVDGPLDRANIKTLCSYSRHGHLQQVVVPYGEEEGRSKTRLEELLEKMEARYGEHG